MKTLKTLNAAGVLLTADADTRVLTYRLLPYGEPGRTNVGTVTASKGTLTLPHDPSTMHLNIEHDRTRPVGKCVNLTEDDAGLTASFTIAATTAGNDLLAEATEGLRPGVSVEITSPLVRAGRLLGGVLHHAGAVTEPAFPSALLVAADAGTLDVEVEVREENVVLIGGVEYTLQEDGTYAPTKPPETTAEPPVAEIAASAAGSRAARSNLTARSVAAAGVGGGRRTAVVTEPERTAAQVFRMLATAYRTGNQGLLTAALANVVHDDGDNDGDGLGEIAAAPGWLGEVYSKASYVRRYIPLLLTGTLTSFKETGYNYATLPVVAKYSGNKADVPTGGMTAVPVTFTVEQWAHAADLDRRFIDFGDTTVVADFIAAQVNSYKKETDLETGRDIIANAGTFTPGAVPTDINEVLSAIVDGALALQAADFSPSFAIVGADIFRSFALTRKDAVPEYLSSTAGLDEGSAGGFRIISSSLPEAAGQVVVGDGTSARFKELGGGAPVRVEAEHVAQRGRDLGVFGYTSYQELAADGVVKASLVVIP